MITKGRILRLIRESLDISQDEASKKMDISPSYLSLIEHGKKEPSHDVLRKIADLYKIPLNLLVWDESDIEKRTLDKKERDLLKKMNGYMETLLFQIMNRNVKKT